MSGQLSAIGAGNFRILAQNVLRRINTDYGKRIEVWAFDRRTNQLEDTKGLDISERLLDPEIGVNWLFGAELGGFQVFVNQGFAHLDVLTAEDNADNNVVGPLSDFIARNIQ